MIKSSSGERLTPKQKAQELLMEQVSAAMYRLDDDAADMTERELELVRQQIVKQKERVEKLFGYVSGSWSFG